MSIEIDTKTFSFRLRKPLRTSQGFLREKKGWLLRLKNKSGNYGWGEVSPVEPNEFQKCKEAIKYLSSSPKREYLESSIATWPGALAFGLGAAFAELDGVIGSNNNTKWLPAPTSAFLLSGGTSIINELDELVKKHERKDCLLTVKLKVATQSDNKEKKVVSEILNRLPEKSRIRLDANGGWSREQANSWADLLDTEPRLEWLEQPLATDDLQGLLELSKKIPIALDESLVAYPFLRDKWEGWQIRRPSQEGDPRITLKELKEESAYKAFSSTFETGIGKRWLNHLAALQQTGSTPTAPGLAPGWVPDSSLFSDDPKLVWESV